jgi:hypothetical protein
MSKLIKCFDYAQVVKVDLQREQFTANGMHVNRQGKDVTARCLVLAIRNIFIHRHCGSPIILNWGEDQQDRGRNVSSGKRMINGDSELTANKLQGKCHNGINLNLESDILQNIRSDRAQDARNNTVPTSEHLSEDITCPINWKRVKTFPKSRSDDFLWT